MIKEHCRNLERVSKLPDLKKDEVESVKLAALALHYLFNENQLKSFLEYVATADSPLSDEEVTKLRSLGLEP